MQTYIHHFKQLGKLGSQVVALAKLNKFKKKKSGIDAIKLCFYMI